ncbi:MAG: TIGR02556 family CRISPR-associated protein [Calditerrivibrio sp.]|uniref:TIGR02556 family CRISPR-associated protein n=1 Tax=Calditerrivibrio sp. TaxID=2792612 RepID=UPI003D0D0200
MLTAIKEIGEIVTVKEKNIDGKVLTIMLDNEQTYLGIEIEDYDSEKVNKYLYKEGASKGNAPSPFCPITEPIKSFKKLDDWLKKCVDMCSNEEESNKYFISKIYKMIRKNERDIREDLRSKINEIPKKTSKFLTIKIDRKFLGEYDIFRKCVDSFAEEKRKKSASVGTCSVCGKFDTEVSGKTDVFKFYTIDKRGFITGGFDESHAWKNFPVCIECNSLLENGKKFIDTKLNFKFDGLNYYLIPRLLIGSKDILKEILEIMSDTNKVISLKERIKKRITSDENEILEYLSEIKDILTINFLFLRREQSAERILLLIEDVLPSRIKKIFEAKDRVDNIFIEEFNFGRIRIFFSKSDEGKKENDLNKYFLEIVDSVFKGKRLEFSFIVKFYMAVIRKEFIKDRYFSSRVKDALMSTIFFENLGLITFEEVKDMEESIFSSIFGRYGKSLSSSVKRGIFLMGSLTQLLLNKQWSERNSKSFMKKLKGLKMDEKDIKALLSEVQNKLEEYDAFDKGKRAIASEISKYFLEAGEGWKMSVDEINFYFACGMNLASDVASIVYKKENIIDKEE